MPTLVDILNQSEKFLKKKNIANARLEAEFIFTKALSCKRIDLYLRYHSKLNDGELNNIRVLLTRRGRHEPLQYIMDEWPFHELVLHLDKRALIPRQETEYFIECLIKMFEKHVDDKIDIIDIGTGSGAIALSLAKYFKNASTTAIDFSKDALSLAEENAKKNRIKNICFKQSDWFSNVFGKFDLMVSNPPYLSENEWENTQPEIKMFEPKVALMADQDGQGSLLKIIQEAGKFLKKNGILALETGETQHPNLIKFSEKFFKYAKSIKDRCYRDRFIILSNSDKYRFS